MLQFIGSLFLLFAFFDALLGFVARPIVVLAVIGIYDAWLIWGLKRESISEWIRRLAPWHIDRIILVGLVPLCWWLCGSQVALWFTLGLLNAHFFNIEEKKGN
jgi:hypothetical protein